MPHHSNVVVFAVALEEKSINNFEEYYRSRIRVRFTSGFIDPTVV